jgi:(p)ppGpp synthase/HD superfamily hydrolase
MKLLRKALKFAAEKHKGQTRKVSELPYIIHPVEVSFLVSKYKSSKRLEELMCAAILHDVLEDTDTNFIELASEFTPLVASLVLELSSDTDEIKRIGKNEYLKKKMLGMSNYGLFLKLCDRLSNISDNPTEKYLENTIDLIEFIVSNRSLTKSQKRVITAIKEVLYN